MEDSSKEKGLLPPLPRVKGLKNVDDPLELLSADEQEKLHRELDSMARERREAEAASSPLRLG